jgi:hypothetical protein
MNKTQWIQSQIALGVTDFSVLNTPILVTNPAPSEYKPKAVNLTAIVADISDADILLLNTTYSSLVSALIENINKGSISDLANLIRGLNASNLSQEAKDSINSTFQSIAASYQDPKSFGDLVPKPEKVLLTPAQEAEFDMITLQDWEKALN